MSERTFWLLISVTIVLIGILFMLLGWAMTNQGGWCCVIGVLCICVGGGLAGFTKEE